MPMHRPTYPCGHQTEAARPPSDSARHMLSDKDRCQRKRHRDQSSSRAVEEKPSAKTKTASHNHPPEFWNALSKIKLTRRALKELDRRTTGEKSKLVVEAARRSTRLLRSDTMKLVRFANNGGPNLNHLRGYDDLQQPVATMSKLSSRQGKRTRDSDLPSSDLAIGTTTTGPYDPQFEQMLIDNGIYPDEHRAADGTGPLEPRNLNELRRTLAQTRPPLSPSAFSEQAFKDFKYLNRMGKSESKIMSSVIPIIAGAKDRYCTTEENIRFNNLEKFASGLSMPQPDRYYGARPGQIDQQVVRDLDKYIIPSNFRHLPAAPNFFFEGKSAQGRADVALRQVTHDNAYGARAMFQLQNYGKETPVYDGNAYSLGSFYHPTTGTLLIYATHPRRSVTGRTEYHITQLGSYAMTNTLVTFREGATAFRNARDFAQKQRGRFIASANAIAQSAGTNVSSNGADSRAGISFATANCSVGPDTSTDELALHHNAASDESDGDARPRKRMTRAATKARHLRSNTQASTK